MKSGARFPQVHHHQPQHQRKGRDHLEINQRPDADPPELLRSPIEAMPCVTVQKMIGAMIIFTSLMNPSPKGFRVLPKSGKSQPVMIPMSTATSTWMYNT